MEMVRDEFGMESPTQSSNKLSRLAYAQANSKNIGGDKGPDKSYWEIGYTEDDKGGGYRFRNSLAEAEYVEYVNYKGGDEDLEDSTNENKKVRGKHRGSGKYDVKMREALKLAKEEHKKLRRRGPDRQDFPKVPDEYSDERVRARIRRDEAAAAQAIGEGGVVVLPEEDVPYVEEEREELEELIRSNDEEEGARLAKDKKDIEMVRLAGVQREHMERIKPSREKGAARATRNPWELKRV